MSTLILLLASGVGNPPAAPLHCPTANTGKGEVKGGPPLVHTFELTNRGTGTITITRVEAGCGCLRQSLSSGVLGAGETVKLTLEVNTLTQPDGPNRWQISVGYKSETAEAQPLTGEVLLQITANLSRDVAVNPPQVGFSTTGAASQVLIVTDKRGKPLSVVKVTTSSAHLTAEIGARENGKGQPITVKLSPDTPVGHRDESVVLLTDDPAYPELRVPVRVLKRATCGVSVAPESVVLRFAAGQTELSTLVQLRATRREANRGQRGRQRSTRCKRQVLTGFKRRSRGARNSD